jgi:hypothetical protein
MVQDLDRLAANGIFVINHSPGRGEPKYLSPEHMDQLEFVVQEAAKRGMKVWPEPMPMTGRRPVSPPLQNLHHRLLDESNQHRRHAELSHPFVRLGDFYPLYRLRSVNPVVPKTGSASGRAGCRARCKGLGCYPGPMRRTIDPFRFLLISVAGWVS